MKRSVIALLIAIALIVFGAVLAGCSLLGMDGTWDMLTDSSKVITTMDYIEGDFSKLEIETDTLDVFVFPSPDGTCYYEARTYNNMYCSVSVESDTLIIRQEDDRKWYHHIGIFWGETSLALYLPESSYERLTLSSDTGDVNLTEDFSFHTVRISTDTGDVNIAAAVTELLDIDVDTGYVSILNSSPKSLTVKSDTGNCFLRGVAVQAQIFVKTATGNIAAVDTCCQTLSIQTDTGDAELENVVVSGDADLRSATGDWELHGFDAANITIETNTGDVEGTLLSDKIFFADSDTGDVEVPRTNAGGTCQINTITGDIEIDIVP